MHGVWGYWICMPSFHDLLSQGATHAWLYIPIAILLGALHGLEPGHSKTMMAAFIVAVRGTIPQAVLLGISAAFSHSLIIWLLAAVALRFGSRWNAETTEPYFQLASGIIIVGLAVWMFFRTRREDQAAADHHHGGDGPHEGQMINTGHGFVEVSVFETNVPPRFRLYFFDESNNPKAPPPAGGISVKTVRPGGGRQSFSFVPGDGYLEAESELPEPHEFEATLEMPHGDHRHTYSFQFSEHDHGELDLSDGDYQDAHERAHASDIAPPFCQQKRHHGPDCPFWTHRRAAPLSGGAHRPAGLSATEAIHPRLCARSRVQRGPGPNYGSRWHRRRMECSARFKTNQRLR